MAKFVCDVEQVVAAGEKLITMSNDLNSSVSNYHGTVTSDLASWDGSAKNSFSKQCEAQVKLAQVNADEAKNVGEFVKASAQAIQSLEDELATINI